MTKGYRLEKRKIHRLARPLKATATIGTDAITLLSKPVLQFECRNISHQGVGLESKNLQISGIRLLEGRPLSRDHRLHLKITLFQGEPDFCAVGEVRWYNMLHQDGRCLYQLGIEFIEFQEEDKKRLLKFLKQQKSPGIIRKLFQRIFPA